MARFGDISNIKAVINIKCELRVENSQFSLKDNRMKKFEKSTRRKK